MIYIYSLCPRQGDHMVKYTWYEKRKNISNESQINCSNWVEEEYQLMGVKAENKGTLEQNKDDFRRVSKTQQPY